MNSEREKGIFVDSTMNIYRAWRVYLGYFIIAISVEIALKACTIPCNFYPDR